MGQNGPMGTTGTERTRRRIDPLERVLNLFTLLHRSRVPMTREQIVAEMARGMTPYPTAEEEPPESTRVTPSDPATTRECPDVATPALPRWREGRTR